MYTGILVPIIFIRVLFRLITVYLHPFCLIKLRCAVLMPILQFVLMVRLSY